MTPSVVEPVETTPVVVRTRQELHDHLAGVRAGGGRVALVPTMGALHEGHATLAREAGRLVGPDDVVVVSIFVNPLQFGAGEDLDRYPRTFDADLEVCAREGVHVVFAPAADEVYPGGEPEVTLDPGPLGSVLEGAVRPTHFRGVLTVVAKLVGLVRPDVAVFGEKDYQQLVLIRRMAADLCLGVDVVGIPTVREADGLALSSRNRYLSDDERQVALALSAALRAGAEASDRGADAVLAAGHEVLAGHPEVALDYLALTAPDLHDPPASGPARLLVAGRVGTTRLIDNLALDLASSSVEPVEPVETRTTEGAR